MPWPARVTMHTLPSLAGKIVDQFGYIIGIGGRYEKVREPPYIRDCLICGRILANILAQQYEGDQRVRLALLGTEQRFVAFRAHNDDQIRPRLGTFGNEVIPAD